MTQQEKIIITMLRSDQQWWLPFDFMKRDRGDLFVGYEAGPRLSELRSEYPNMVESKKDGKYIATRVRKEAIGEWFMTLPKYLRQIVAKELDYYPQVPGNRYHPSYARTAQVIDDDKGASTLKQESLL